MKEHFDFDTDFLTKSTLRKTVVGPLQLEDQPAVRSWRTFLFGVIGGGILSTLIIVIWLVSVSNS